MKKFKRIFLSSSVSLAVSLTAFTPVAQANASKDSQQIAASVIQFLVNTMYPDNHLLGNEDKDILATPKAEEAAKKASRFLVLSTLSNTIAVTGAPLVTHRGIEEGSKTTNPARTFSNRNMGMFLCGRNQSSSNNTCLYTPKHLSGLMQTLTGNPYASRAGGLTASDTLLTNTEASRIESNGGSGFNYNNSNSGGNQGRTSSFDKSSYFNYNHIFSDMEPESLEPAKYYGLFVTGAYDANLLAEQPGIRTLIRNAVRSGKMHELRNNPIYQRFVLLTRKLTATNSALMSNILWLAQQHSTTLKKEESPTGEPMNQAEADEYIGDHRLNDHGKWVDKIKNESTVALLREQTLMMAEANHQREENEKIMKRILATVTIIAAENKELFQITEELRPKHKKAKNS
jgi:hypothetical protein